MTQETNLPNDNKFLVMVCVDESNHAQQAFDYYVSHLHRPGNKVIMVHVANMVYPVEYAHSGAVYTMPDGVIPSPAVAKQVMEKEKQRSNKIRDKYTSKCEKLNIDYAFVILHEDTNGIGAPIVAEAKKREVSLILLGTRGQGLVRRTILGSVSDYVLHHSHVPTVVCPKHA